VPLKLVKARNAKTSNLYIRGAYLGFTVDQSCRTDRRSVAQSILKRIEGEIERGEFGKTIASPRSPTFLSAALAYLEAGRRRRYVAKLIKHFGETPLDQIDQAAIDEAAIALHPNAGNATRNAGVYTPVSAILHHAGVEIKLKRPKGAKGRIVTDWLRSEDADAVIVAADQISAEFGTLLRALLHTGLRLGEVLDRWHWEDLNLDEGSAWTRREKGGIESDVKLRPDLVTALRALRPREGQGRVFRFHQGGHLKHLLTRAKLAALGIPCPVRRPIGWRPPDNRLSWVNFHSFRHTWGTWMRRYGGLDTKGLVATGNWRDERSASRYAHAVMREEWDRVNRLPSVGETTGTAAIANQK
jgi:integrase